MCIETIDSLLEQKRQQIEMEKAAFVPDLVEKLREGGGCLLEKIVIEGFAEVYFAESNFTQSRVRRLTSFLPGMVDDMNEKSKNATFLLIKGNYKEDPEFVGIRIMGKRSEPEVIETKIRMEGK